MDASLSTPNYYSFQIIQSLLFHVIQGQRENYTHPHFKFTVLLSVYKNTT